MYEECLNAVLQENKRIALRWHYGYDRYNLSPSEQEDDEGEDGRGEDNLHLGVQPLLVIRAGGAVMQSLNQRFEPKRVSFIEKILTE